MRNILSTFISIAFALLIAFLFTRFASAHGDEPRIEISAIRISPGSVLDIRGVDFEFEEEVTLVLIGSQAEVPLGTVTASVEGTFLLTITLPADLVEGEYLIRGTTDDHVIDSPSMTVWGTALMEGGGQGERDEDDGLLAPMPTFAPATPVPASAGTVAEPSDPVRSSSPVLGIAAGIALVLVLGLVFLFQKRP